MPPGWLVIESSGVRTRLRLSGGPQTLGRAPDNDLVVSVPFVSRHHARLTWEGDRLRLTDAGSTFGLRWNSRPVQECVLAPGDVAEIVGPHAGDVARLSYVVGNADVATPIVQEHARADSQASTDSAVKVSRRHPLPSRIRIGRDAGNDLILNHPLVSRRHATLDIRLDGARLTDQHSTNGTFLNGVRVDQQRDVRAGDRIRIGAYELEFDGQRLIPHDQTERARLDGLHLSRVVSNGDTILHDVTLSALPNEMIAVVGPSGAGKSTLMKALSGFEPATSGTVLVNGRDYYREFAAMRLMVGYVPQADVVHRDLPAERALGYAAELRLPADTSGEERASRVDDVLRDVELTDRRTVQVGSLSGGQIKRVSIGVELLSGPSLFFLDEPTSGLDPGLEKHVMELLRVLANRGRTVLLVTHATQSIELCHHVAFMAPGGYLAFFGPPRAALSYFDCMDYAGIYGRLQDGDGEDWAKRYQLHDASRRYVQARLPEQKSIEVESSPAPTSPLTAPALPIHRQLGVLVRRYAETTARDRRNLTLLLLQAPIIAILAALIAKPGAFTALPAAAGSRNLLVILSCSVIWLGAMNAAREVVKELPIYRRERMVGLGLLPYLASKYVILGALCLVQAALLLAIVALRARLPAQDLLLPGPLELYVTLLLSSVAGLAMGLMVSTLFENADRATALVPYLLIPQIIFVVAPLSGASRLVAWLTISHWSVQALGSTANLAQFAPALGGLDPAEYTHDAGFLLSRWLILLAMTAIFGIASLVFQKRRDGALM